MNVYRSKYKDQNGKKKLYSRYRIDFIDGKEITRIVADELSRTFRV